MTREALGLSRSIYTLCFRSKVGKADIDDKHLQGQRLGTLIYMAPASYLICNRHERVESVSFMISVYGPSLDIG